MEDSKKNTQEHPSEDPPPDGNFQADVQEDDRAAEEDPVHIYKSPGLIYPVLINGSAHTGIRNDMVRNAGNDAAVPWGLGTSNDAPGVRDTTGGLSVRIRIRT